MLVDEPPPPEGTEKTVRLDPLPDGEEYDDDTGDNGDPDDWETL